MKVFHVVGFSLYHLMIFAVAALDVMVTFFSSLMNKIQVVFVFFGYGSVYYRLCNAALLQHIINYCAYLQPQMTIWFDKYLIYA